MKLLKSLLSATAALAIGTKNSLGDIKDSIMEGVGSLRPAKDVLAEAKEARGGAGIREAIASEWTPLKAELAHLGDIIRGRAETVTAKAKSIVSEGRYVADKFEATETSGLG